MKTNKKTAIKILTIILILFLGNSVSAFSVGSAYHKNNPLNLSPGDSTIISFSLQNMAGDKNITAKANILQSSEIMEMIDSSNIYEVPAGGEKIVNIKVSIPSEAKIGDVYKAELEFSTITENKKGTFGFGSAVGKKFDIIVTAPEKAALPEEKLQTKTLIPLLIILIIILIIISIIILKKKKNKRFKNRAS